MRIIQNRSPKAEQNFMHNKLSECSTALMLIGFTASIIVLIFLSFSSPPLIYSREFFYPFSESFDLPSKKFQFVFSGYSFFHRYVQLDASLVRYYYSSNEEKRITNHVNEDIYYGLNSFFYVSNETDITFDQNIIFPSGENESNVYSFYVVDKSEYTAINITFIYEFNYSDIAGFNFKFSHAEFNIQYFLDQARQLLFFLTIFVCYYSIRNYLTNDFKSYRYEFAIEITSLLALSPIYSYTMISYFKYICPIFTFALLVEFRLYSIFLLEASLNIGKSRSFSKSVKIFILIYSLIEFKEVFDRHLYVNGPQHVSYFAFYKWLMVFCHFSYFVIGIYYCFRLLNLKKSAEFCLTWSFRVAMFVYVASLFTSFFVNVVLEFVYVRPVIDSIFPALVYIFPIHISIFVYSKILLKSAKDLDKYFYLFSEQIQEAEPDLI